MFGDYGQKGDAELLSASLRSGHTCVVIAGEDVEFASTRSVPDVIAELQRLCSWSPHNGLIGTALRVPSISISSFESPSPRIRLVVKSTNLKFVAGAVLIADVTKGGSGSCLRGVLRAHRPFLALQIFVETVFGLIAISAAYSVVFQPDRADRAAATFVALLGCFLFIFWGRSALSETTEPKLTIRSLCADATDER